MKVYKLVVVMCLTESNYIVLQAPNMNTGGTGLNVESKFGGSGEPVKTYSGSTRTRFPTTMRKDIYGSKSELSGDLSSVKSAGEKRPFFISSHFYVK